MAWMPMSLPELISELEKRHREKAEINDLRGQIVQAFRSLPDFFYPTLDFLEKYPGSMDPAVADRLEAIVRMYRKLPARPPRE